jgi:hypothetical protein
MQGCGLGSCGSRLRTVGDLTDTVMNTVILVGLRSDQPVARGNEIHEGPTVDLQLYNGVHSDLKTAGNWTVQGRKRSCHEEHSCPAGGQLSACGKQYDADWKAEFIVHSHFLHIC